MILLIVATHRVNASSSGRCRRGPGEEGAQDGIQVEQVDFLALRSRSASDEKMADRVDFAHDSVWGFDGV